MIGQLQRQVDEHEAQYGDELLAASERIKVRNHIIAPTARTCQRLPYSRL